MRAPDGYIPIRDAADRLGIPSEEFFNAAKRGDVPGAELHQAGGHIRWFMSDDAVNAFDVAAFWRRKGKAACPRCNRMVRWRVKTNPQITWSHSCVAPDIIQSEYVADRMFQNGFECVVDEAGDIVSDRDGWIAKAVSQREARAALVAKVREQLPTGVKLNDLEQLASVLPEVDYHTIDPDAAVTLLALLAFGSTAADPGVRDMALAAAERLAKDFDMTQMLWAARMRSEPSSMD